jgi:hypothetical protein
MKKSGILVPLIALGTLALLGCSRESADWKSATAADTTEAYQQFLQQHPNSASAVQARAHIKLLEEDRDWQSAAAADTRDAYQQFVAQHADGKWAQEARIRIENFAQAGGAGVAAAAAAAGGSASAGNAASTGNAVAGNAVAGAQPSAPPAAVPAAMSPEGPARAAAVKSPHARLADAGGGHFVQLGAFHSRQRAESEWKWLSIHFPSEFKSLRPRYVAATARGAHVYRLQVAVSSATDARGLCATLKKHSQACVPVTA